MVKKPQTLPCKPSGLILGVIVVALIIIAISSVTHTTLALKENSEGNSDVVRVHCVNGLEQAAVEAGVCSQDDLSKIPAILSLRGSQGIKTAKDACFSQITNPGCRGLCVAVINCYDLEM